MGDDSNEGNERRGSPRARARAHLRRMLQTASIIAAASCGDDGSTGSTDPCAPDGCDPVPPPTTSDTGNDSVTSTSGADSTGSTTWDDPCAEDGCDPVPPPMTSTGPEPDTDTDGTGSGSGSDTGSGSGSSSGAG